MHKTFDKKKFLSQNSIWLVLIAMVIIMGVAQPSFFTVNNLLTLLSGEAVKGILAFGVMFAILSKGIDLTIGRPGCLHHGISGSAGRLCQRSIPRSGLPARTAGYSDRSGNRRRHRRYLRCDHRVHQDSALHRNARRTADLPRKRKNVHQPPGFQPDLGVPFPRLC